MNTIIPAQPGFFVANKISAGEATLDPVIAWSIDQMEALRLVIVMPITVEEGLIEGVVPIVRPDGTVVADDTYFTSVSDWLAAV